MDIASFIANEKDKKTSTITKKGISSGIEINPDEQDLPEVFPLPLDFSTRKMVS